MSILIMPQKVDGVKSVLLVKVRPFPFQGGVGSIRIFLNNPRKYAYIQELFISKQCRRRGYASELMQAAMLEAKQRGFEDVGIYVEHKNKQAIALYERLGFETAHTSEQDARGFHMVYHSLQKFGRRQPE